MYQQRTEGTHMTTRSLTTRRITVATNRNSIRFAIEKSGLDYVNSVTLIDSNTDASCYEIIGTPPTDELIQLARLAFTTAQYVLLMDTLRNARHTSAHSLELEEILTLLAEADAP